jgi:hypothetical protein
MRVPIIPDTIRINEGAAPPLPSLPRTQLTDWRKLAQFAQKMLQTKANQVPTYDFAERNTSRD